MVTDPHAYIPVSRAEDLPTTGEPHWLEGHNVWLNVLGQAGVVGVALFAWLAYEIVRGARRARPLARDLAPLGTTLVGVFAGMLLYGGLFSAIEETRHVWAALGLVAAWLAVAARPSARRA